MSEQSLSFKDTYVNSTSNRQATSYAAGVWVQVQSGVLTGLLKVDLPNIFGRTVESAPLVGHAAKATSAQTLTIKPTTSKWAAGRVTYSTQKPTVDGAAAISAAIPALAAGESFTIALGPIFQAIANGTEYTGLEITTNAATAQAFWSVDSGEPSWEMTLELADEVEIPVGLKPDGGLAVGSATPILGWDPVGDSTTSQQSQSQVQVDTPAALADPDAVTPDYDSGLVANTDPTWALAGRHTLVGAGPHYWRVRTENDPAGWSDWAEFTVSARPVLVLDSPTGPFGDPSPTVLAHMTGETMTKWQAKVTGPDRSDVRARSGLVTGSTIAYEVPFRADRTTGRPGGTGGSTRRVLRDDEGGWLHLRAWGTTARAEAINEPPYVEGWFPLEFDNDLGVQAPTGLTVARVAQGSPLHVWSWSRTEAGDAWAPAIGDLTIARVDPADVEVDGGRYYWYDNGELAPLRSQAVSIRAIEGNSRSEPAEATVQGEELKGVWLIPEADIDPIVLAGTGVGDWLREDFVATYTTSVGDLVDITYGQPGFAATFDGTIDSREDVWATLANVEALRQSKNRNAQLVWGSRSVKVRVRSIDSTPADDILPNNLLHNVRVSVVQLDDR